ncbi:MFS transporter [Streptomyces sp. NPDC001393]
MLSRVRSRDLLAGLLPEKGPARTLTLITAVHGQGLWAAISAIYATSVVGLSAGQFAVGVVVAAAVSLASSTPAGHLADRIGARTVQLWSLILLGPLTLGLLLVHGLAGYVVVVSLQSAAFSASRSARMAMIAGLVPAEQRVRIRAYLRATTNTSLALGATLAGFILAVGTPTAYRSAVVINGAIYLTGGLLTLLLPAVPSQPARPGPRLEVLTDRPYLSLVLLDGVLSMHNQLLEVVLPLWVVECTHAPRWMVATILVVNTVAVVLLQVRAAKGSDQPRGAARSVRFGAAFVGLACTAFAFSDGRSAVFASVLLALGAGLHVVGEIWQSAGSWGISFGLAPDHAQGQYQGTYAMSADLGKLVAPALLVWLAIGHRTGGWLVMAIAFALIGACFPPIVAWAERNRRSAPDLGAAVPESS